MKKTAASLAFCLALVATPALAQSFQQLMDDAQAEDAAGNSRLEDADWQFRDGNVQQGCEIMEQARQHYVQVESDLKAMDDMVHDPANGYSDDDQQRAMDWINQNQATLNDIAGRMADTYRDKCAS